MPHSVVIKNHEHTEGCSEANVNLAPVKAAEPVTEAV